MTGKPLYANSKGQLLDSHLIGVSMRAIELIQNEKYSNALSDREKDNFIKIVALSGLLHDIGKVSAQFQQYIKKQKNTDELGFSEEDLRQMHGKSWHGITHQEFSFWFAANLFLGSISVRDAVRYGIYYHHPVPVTPDGFRDTTGKIQSELLEYCNLADNDLDRGVFVEMALFLEASLIPKIKTLSTGPNSHLLLELSQSLTLNSEIDDQISVPLYSDPSATIDKRAAQFYCLQVLIQADRQISSLSPADLESYINNKFKFQTRDKPIEQYPEFAFEASDSRSKEQLALAQKIADCKNTCILAVDTGAGKTSVSILASSLRKERKKLIVLLPERNQVEAMYKSVKDDYLRIFGQETKSLQAVHSNKVVLSESADHNALDSDINILIFDRFIWSAYDRTRYNELWEILSSDLIIDEFAKFNEIMNMWPALGVILKIRSWLTNMTVVASATPANILIEEIAGLTRGVNLDSFDRSELSALYPDSKLDVRLLTQEDARKESLVGGTMRTFNTISKCQREWIHFKSNSDDMIIHSAYEDSDEKSRKRELSELALSTFGRHSKSNLDIYSAKMLQASFNISRENAVLPVKLPFETCQEVGRVLRFGEAQNGQCLLIHNLEDGLSLYKDNLFGFRGLFVAYHKYVESVFRSTGLVTLNKREFLKLFFDDFFNSKEVRYELTRDEALNYSGKKELVGTESIYRFYIKKYYKEALEEMKSEFPKRGSKTAKKNTGTSARNVLRGGSCYVTAKKIKSFSVDELLNLGGNEMSGAISVNEDLKDRALKTLDCLRLSEQYTYVEESVLKYQSWKIGSKDAPIPCSSTKIEHDQIMKSKFEASKNSPKASYYAVYFEDIGLYKIEE